MPSVQDPEQSAQGEAIDFVPELPLVPPVPSATHHHHHLHTHHPSKDERPHNPRQPSHTRSVDIEFFDPSGVGELRRTLSRVSTERGQAIAPSQISEVSDDTLTSEAQFDLEKCMREFVQKCVCYLIHRASTDCLSCSI